VIKEIIDTEEDYIRDLEVIINVPTRTSHHHHHLSLSLSLFASWPAVDDLHAPNTHRCISWR
jgi:hypothetical protein